MRPVAPLLAAAALVPAGALAQGACSATSSAQPPALVELYTSEGCSSCPPADRWLSSLVGRSDVLALAFHVDYWDRLGWPDRFATAATTERQHRLQRASGARYVYTPQVLLNGLDLRGWANAALPRLPASTVTLRLARDGNVVSAHVGAAPYPLAGYWAVLEDGHVSRVKAGENSGATLRHDHVVTSYRALPAWPAGSVQQFRLELPAPAAATPPRRIAFVVTDAAGARPLQALQLAC